MSLEDWKIKRATKKEEKKIKKEEKLADTLADSNEMRKELAKRHEKVKEKVSIEKIHAQILDREQLEREVREARQNLFIQRDKLLKLVINYNKEYKYVMSKPNTSIKKKELDRCSTGAKKAAYALAVVENAIDRLDEIPTEYEWHQIMRDLTNGYKMMNSISLGADLLTRLAFRMHKAKAEMKGDISVHAMEHYYGKSIDKLLEEENVDGTAVQLLVKDDALDLDDEDAILEAITWGTIYTVSPDEFNKAAQDQSFEAQKTGKKQIIENPDETFVHPQDISTALDDLPSNVS